MALSSGIAIWSESYSAKAAIHVNLWKVDRAKEKDCHFLDIGVYLDKKDNNEPQTNEQLLITPHIKIYLPFDTTNVKFIDLYEKIALESSIYDIFNKPKLQVTTNAEEGFAQVSGYENDDLFVSSSDIKTDAQSKNIVDVFPTYRGEKNIYIRIRIMLDKNTEKYFLKRFRPKTSFLLPSFKEIEHVSFSINERRGMPLTPSLGVANSKLKINKIDFFLVRESEAALLSQHSPFKRCRELEHNLWRSYLPDETKDFDRKLAYHWQEKIKDTDKDSDKEIEHFGAFVKFSYSIDGFGVLFTYLIIAILMGAFAGSAGNYISDVNGTALFPQTKSLHSDNLVGMSIAYLIGIVIIVLIVSHVKIRYLVDKICEKIKKCCN